MKPFLRKYKEHWELSDYPEGCSYEAGFLVTKNAAWRTQRVVLDANKCTGCLQCYLYCPDGVIAREGKKVAFDYDFCKGCGICAKICKFGALSMEEEKER